MAYTIRGKLNGDPTAPLSPAERAAVANNLLERKLKTLASLTAAYTAVHADDIRSRPTSPERRAELAYAESQFVAAYQAHAGINT